ncbi:MAG: ribosome small subunit-dependent GTPase A [Gallionella sp.]
MKRKAGLAQDQLFSGQVVAAFGRQYLVELANGNTIACLTRGKKSEAACGDIVQIRSTEDRTDETSSRIESQITGVPTASKEDSVAQGVIENISPRSSCLHRSDAYRAKMVAANVTQIIVVVAAEPSFSDELLARCLIAAFDQQLEVLIVLNKCDLHTAAEYARARLSPYAAIGYRVLELSAMQDISSLLPRLRDHSSVLVGQSGMGKSTLINALLPDAHAATREISRVLDSGKHTTTHARLYRIDASSSLIDCPGVQAFGLHHLSFGRIEQGFVEFAKYLGLCRFHDCRHLHEPGCALINAVTLGRINARRLELFQHITTTRS